MHAVPASLSNLSRRRDPKGWRAWALLLVMGLLWCLAAPAADVTGSVNWTAPTGRTATTRHYGLNLFHGYTPSVAGTPGNATYKANTAYMRPGLIRYHHGDQILASSNARGWVLSPDTAAYAWDTNKINNALSGAFTYGPVTMMTIVRWPAYMNVSASDQRLATAHYTNFANFCADLVRTVNLRQGRNVRYWEISNELETKGYWNTMDEVARIHRLAALAMKSVDPTIKVGGAAFGSPEVADHLNKFLSTIRSLNAPLDFVSYHQYPNYQDKNFTATDAAIWNQAAALGNITATVRAAVSNHFGATNPIELFHDEYNINWTWKSGQTPPSELRMRDMKGAVWDALAMISIVNAGADGATAWNEADLAFGKLHTDYSRRPAAHVYAEFNQDLTGEVVTTASGDNGKVVLFALRGGTVRKLALVNRAGTNQTVQLSFSGWTSTVTTNTTLTLKRAAVGGLTTNTINYGALTNSAGLLLPADTITVLLVDEGTLPPPAPTGLNAAPGEAKVQLRWSPAVRAISYRVKRAAVSGGPYTAVASGVTTTNYTDVGRAGGVPVYYVVSAENAAGEGAVSSEVMSVPILPVLGFSFSAGQFALSWPTAAVNYTLHMATSLQPPVLWSPLTNPPVSTAGVFRILASTNLPQGFYRLRTP